MSIKIADNPGLAVQTDPVIQLDNGIRIWLGEKGEQVKIDPDSWSFIWAAIKNLHNLERVTWDQTDQHKEQKEFSLEYQTKWYSVSTTKTESSQTTTSHIRTWLSRLRTQMRGFMKRVMKIQQ